MAELLLGLGALLSIAVVLMLFYLLIKRRDFYLSDEGKRRIDERKFRFKVVAVLGVVAFLLFVGAEIAEAVEVFMHLPEELEELLERSELLQVSIMLVAQLLTLSIALRARRSEGSGAV